jgi:hypothetical protein
MIYGAHFLACRLLLQHPLNALARLRASPRPYSLRGEPRCRSLLHAPP